MKKNKDIELLVGVELNEDETLGICGGVTVKGAPETDVKMIQNFIWPINELYNFK